MWDIVSYNYVSVLDMQLWTVSRLLIIVTSNDQLAIN